MKNKQEKAPKTKKKSEIDITVEPFRSFYGIRPTYKRTLRLQNTGEIFMCSPEDWMKANCCGWNINADGRIVNKQGIFFEEYVGIKTGRNVFTTHPLDLSRYNYEASHG